MAKTLSEKKTMIGLENKYLFEIKDLNLNSVGEYISVLKMQLAKVQGSNLQVISDLQKANEEIERLKKELEAKG